MSEVTMTWVCPDCNRTDEVTLECIDVKGTSHPEGAYGPGEFMWSVLWNYEVEFRCEPCEDNLGPPKAEC